MLVSSDWTVTRSNGNVRYIGDDHGGSAPSYATVIEFHRWLQGLADDAVASGDDELDITNMDPSRRSTDNIITLINGYNIGATEAEHLYDGSIIASVIEIKPSDVIAVSAKSPSKKVDGVWKQASVRVEEIKTPGKRYF